MFKVFSIGRRRVGALSRLCAALAAGLCATLAAADVQAAATTGLWVTPLEIDFGPVGVGMTSAQATVTITNYSAVTLNNFAGGGLGAPFDVSQNCAAGVAPGGSCQYFFTFTPTAAGDFSAASSTSTNLGNISINVHGRGVGAKVVYDAHSLDLGAVYLGNSATQQVVTLRNVGLATLTDFAGGGLSLPFSVTQDCASGVPPGGSCHYYFDFSPVSAGSYTGTSASSTNGGPVTVDVKGSGSSLIFGAGQRVSPLSLDFGPVGVGATSQQLKVEIHNQSAFSTISSFAGGGVASPFSATQDCAAGVPTLGSCYFYYTFAPASVGEFTATSNVSDSYGSFSILLHGTGVAPAQNVTPLWLDFGPVALNTASPFQTVTITNTGMGPLSGWTGGGVGAPFYAIQDCAGKILQPGESCSFSYRFTPTAAGFYTAQSNVSTSAGSFTVLLQGGEHPSDYSLGVTFSGTGSGTVASTPAGLACGASCSSPFPAGTPVALTATPGEYSLFGGWSGICTGIGTCAVTADADKSVTAIFNENTASRAKIGSVLFSTLSLAYAAASSSATDTILAWGVEFVEDLTCGEGKDIILKGGYNGDYSSNTSGYTSLQGVLTVGKGSLTVERLVIL